MGIELTKGKHFDVDDLITNISTILSAACYSSAGSRADTPATRFCEHNAHIIHKAHGRVHDGLGAVSHSFSPAWGCDPTMCLFYVADGLANACTDYQYHDRTVIVEQMPCRCASPLLFPPYNVPHIKHWPRAQDTEWFERVRAERQSREISNALRDMLFSSNTCSWCSNRRVDLIMIIR